MARIRRNFSATEKLAIVRRHLVERVAVSDLCDELGLQPTQIYTWQKQLFEHGATAFDRPNARQSNKGDHAKDREIEMLEARIQQKNEVVAELLQEHVQLKKELGEP